MERARQLAEAFNEQIRLDAERQQAERQKFKARDRAPSDATEVPSSSEDTLTQSFDCLLEINGLQFQTVKMFHPHKGL